jgi:hypothetical protein
VVTLTARKRIMTAAWCCMAMACGNGRLDAFELQRGSLIDDFEDSNNRSAYDLGWWYIVSDHTGSQTLEFVAPPDRPGDKGSLHGYCGGMTGWGAEVGVSFDNPLDARRFSAIEFSAKAGAPETDTAMVVWILDSNHSFNYPTTLNLTWDTDHVPFANVVNTDDSSLRLDTSQVTGIHFAFDNYPNAIDLWLDDVSFVAEP